MRNQGPNISQEEVFQLIAEANSKNPERYFSGNYFTHLLFDRFQGQYHVPHVRKKIDEILEGLYKKGDVHRAEISTDPRKKNKRVCIGYRIRQNTLFS